MTTHPLVARAYATAQALAVTSRREVDRDPVSGAIAGVTERAVDHDGAVAAFRGYVGSLEHVDLTHIDSVALLDAGAQAVRNRALSRPAERARLGRLADGLEAARDAVADDAIVPSGLYLGWIDAL